MHGLVCMLLIFNDMVELSKLINNELKPNLSSHVAKSLFCCSEDLYDTRVSCCSTPGSRTA